jgi:hypothetical protein
MTTQNTHHHNPPAVITAEQLNALYQHDSDLYRTNTTITAAYEQLTRRRHHPLIAGGAATIAAAAAALLTHTSPTTLAAIITIIAAATAAAAYRNRTRRRRHREQHANNLITQDNQLRPWRALTHAITYADLSDPHTLHQASEILRARHTLLHLHPRTTTLRTQLLDLTVRRLALTTHPRHTSALLHHTSDTTLLLIGRWKPLATHISATLPDTAPPGTTPPTHGHHQHVANTLHHLLHTHGDNVLGVANQLAADDPHHNHHWTDLIATAAALTPA